MGNRNNRDWRPGFPRITRIALPEGHIRLRAVFAVVLFALGIGAIVYGVSRLASTQPGWQSVAAEVSGPSYQEEIQLQYDFSDLGGSATAVYKQVSQVYSDAMARAYQAFDSGENSDIGRLNRSPNQAVTVDEGLYRALQQVQQAHNRTVFLAPAYVEYQRVLRSDSDALAESYDPTHNPDLAEYLAQVARYAGDDSQISLDLLEKNQVRLNLSQDCLDFSQENGIDAWLDLSWMRNAFVVDFLAGELEAAGFTHGYLASYDGFTRNLDNRGMSYSYNLFNRGDTGIDMPGVLEYNTPMAIVFLRNYPMSDRDGWHYYTYANGTVTSLMLSPDDGENRVGAQNLVCYAPDQSCGEILLAMLPVYLGQELTREGIAQLEDQGIWSVWPEHGGLCYNNSQSQIHPHQEQGGVTLITLP